MMADRITSEHRSWNMSRIRGKNTLPETRLRSLLHRRGYRFRLHDRKLPGSPDIVLPKHRAVIMVHGCFWHRHEGCPDATTPSTRREFWQAKFDGNVARDQINEERLTGLGWRVIVIWECDLKKDPESVVASINRSLHGGQ
jgi:DNA mismatch endonuclease (patch repair protein)